MVGCEDKLEEKEAVLVWRAFGSDEADVRIAEIIRVEPDEEAVGFE
jgi:hypothetical protein